MIDVVRIGRATLLRGDWLTVQEELKAEHGPFAAVVTDPPYGQRDPGNHGRGRKPSDRFRVRRKPVYGPIHGDDQAFDVTPLRAMAPIVLVWGAHRFAHRLPEASWLVWDKRPNGTRLAQGDGEAAAILLPPHPRRGRGRIVRPVRSRPLRIYRLLWSGACVGSAAKRDVGPGRPRVHPMQKPVAVMAWCIQEARVPAGGTIFDPYMGSGSTGIAALERGHPFVGVEIDQRYFDVACQRIAEVKQP